MNLRLVEWVLVVRYGKSAHAATYGRIGGGSYTKDYIQLYRKSRFLADLEAAFPALQADDGVATVTYKWPSGSATGKLVRKSADRPHLIWDTNSAPLPWRMHEQPTEASVETIRGNPSFEDKTTADLEHDRLYTSGFGQPFLIAVKLRDEIDTLHLRVLIENPDDEFAWADLENAPIQIRELAAATSDRAALAWRHFPAGGSPELYFDPDRKSEPWSDTQSVSNITQSTDSGGATGLPFEGVSTAPTIPGAEESPGLATKPVPQLPTDIDFSNVLVEPPKPKAQAKTNSGGSGGPKKVDHKQKTHMNDAVGKLGEEFAVAYERWRLREHPELLAKLQHVSLEDDTLGYDIESFDLDGTPRYVEVKSTLGKMETRFFLSANELSCAEAKGETYVVLRVAQLAKDPKCCETRFPFEGKLVLTPETYGVEFAIELMGQTDF